MKLQIITTITTLIDIDTFKPEHKVEIDADDAAGLGRTGIMAAVTGGLKSALTAVESDES